MTERERRWNSIPRGRIVPCECGKDPMLKYGDCRWAVVCECGRRADGNTLDEASQKWTVMNGQDMWDSPYRLGKKGGMGVRPPKDRTKTNRRIGE